MPAKQPASTTVYQLKVTLDGSEPPIWRRILVPSDITMARMDQILQTVMGWTNSHLHQFVVGNTYIGMPDPDFGTEARDERRVKLNQCVSGPKSKFVYEYDFGDSWEHVVAVEKMIPAEPGARYPVCVAGERSGPPEDCGGVWGYADLLEAIRDPEHPEHDEMLEWLGDDFDPEAFDLDEVNRGLKRLQVVLVPGEGRERAR